MSNARANAYGAMLLIKEYWRAFDQYDLDIRVDNNTYEIISNMKNGYPPRRAR